MYPEFKQHIADLTQFMSDNGVNTYPLPKVVLNKQPQTTSPIFQTTGHYNPQTKCITLFVHSRHPKDVLRTYAHELYHHHQNLRGEMTPDKMGEDGNDPKYAQNNAHLRKLEREAYMHGNILYRDYCDSKKYGK